MSLLSGLLPPSTRQSWTQYAQWRNCLVAFTLYITFTGCFWNTLMSLVTVHIWQFQTMKLGQAEVILDYSMNNSHEGEYSSPKLTSSSICCPVPVSHIKEKCDQSHFTLIQPSHKVVTDGTLEWSSTLITSCGSVFLFLTVIHMVLLVPPFWFKTVEAE